MQETSLDKHHLAEKCSRDYARGVEEEEEEGGREGGGKKNELIKLLVCGGVGDGDALSLATCKRPEKGPTPGRATLPAGLRTG